MTFGGNQQNDVGKALAAAVSETVNFVIRHSAGVDKELVTCVELGQRLEIMQISHQIVTVEERERWL